MLRELTRIIPELIFLLDHKPFFFLTILLSREQGSTDKDLPTMHGTGQRSQTHGQHYQQML